MVPNHKLACNTILLWYLVNTQNMWGERYPLQRPIFKKDLKISWNNGEKLVHYTHIMWYVFIYEFYYFCINKIVNNNLIFRFWYHLVTISPILVKESGINSTQITTKLLNTSIVMVMMPKYDGERLLIISMPSILEFQDLIVLLGISLSIPMSFQVCNLDCG